MTMEPGFIQIATLMGAGLTAIAAYYFTRLYQRRDERQRATVKVRAQHDTVAIAAKRTR